MEGFATDVPTVDLREGQIKLEIWSTSTNDGGTIHVQEQGQASKVVPSTCMYITLFAIVPKVATF